MEGLVRQRFSSEVECIPFLPKAPDLKVRDYKKKYDFIYVASGEHHKNHEKLIDAWKILAKHNIFPSLALTLSPNDEEKIFKQQDLSTVNIINLGHIPHSNILDAYHESGALIYPSKVESFGIPLIEAKDAGIPIIASELDYVRDLVDPVETFDPCSSTSIARAVMRFLNIKIKGMVINDVEYFLMRIFEDIKR
jgi:glycosyltransferase involved in cell wall biosynthesis